MGKIICKKCGIEARETVLGVYEYEEGIPLRNVPAFECPQCGEFIFTEAQVDEMERKTDLLKGRNAGLQAKSDHLRSVARRGYSPLR